MRRFSILIGLLVLSACSSAGRMPEPGNSLQHPVAPENLTARIVLRVLEERGIVRKIGVVILNPQRVPIQSVRAWVQFDPAVIRDQNLSIEDGRFSLFAPGERTIESHQGFVKIGGAVQEPVRDTEILFATFMVRVPPIPGGTRPTLSFHDWRPEGDGHTAVLSLGTPTIVNVLRPPTSFQL